MSRAQRIDLGGVNVPVISPKDLGVSKILAGRPKDLEDVLGVLQRQREQLDMAAIRALLADLEHTLDQSDLLSVFGRVFRRARR